MEAQIGGAGGGGQDSEEGEKGEAAVKVSVELRPVELVSGPIHFGTYICPGYGIIGKHEARGPNAVVKTGKQVVAPKCLAFLKAFLSRPVAT